MTKKTHWLLYLVPLLSLSSVAADRIVPVFPGTIVIDSDEQIEAEKRAQRPAIENTESLEKKRIDATDRTLPPSPGQVIINSDEQAEIEKRVRQQAIEDAKSRTEESTDTAPLESDPAFEASPVKCEDQ